jgi:hypothetical protein
VNLKVGERERLTRTRFPFSISNDLSLLVIFAFAKLLLHALTNGQYGFHRDELATLDDARHLAWGYVAYPPITPFIGRVALEFFGTSLTGFRFFAAVSQSAALVVAGLMAREFGGRRLAQTVAAVAVGIAPLSLGAGRLFQYVSFDYLWWVLLAYFVVRLLNSDNMRWWAAIGATIGVGMLTKYTMMFLVAGLVVGVLLTPARRHLRSGWLWFGVGLSLLIFLPNLIWEIRHDFISIDFLQSIHGRDIRLGRTDNFLLGQLFVGAALFTIPLAVAGLWHLVIKPEGKRYRVIGWMFLVTLTLFFVAKGRDYYQGPAYPMLLAAGAVWFERWITSLSPTRLRVARITTWTLLALNGALGVVLLLPIAPVNSSMWSVVAKVNGDMREEIGWPELVGTVAEIRESIPAEDRTHLGILTGNYGEAGAINLFGPAYGLPTAISGINSYWLRGYSDPPPQTLIVLGLSSPRSNFLDQNFESCKLAGHITNRFGVMNEETVFHPDIFVCRNLRQPWPEFWKHVKSYG